MNQQEVRDYLERYFAAHQARYEEKTPDYFRVQLPMEVDKDLGNRPFYWTYVERLNLEPQPMFMTLIFNPEKVPSDLRGERISFGSPRLQQFFASAKRHGQYIRLYEHPAQENHLQGNSPLIPWLGVNIRISMICDVKKDLLVSLGFNLVHGTIVESFFTSCSDRDLKPVMPNFAYTIPPIYSIDSALGKLENFIQGMIGKQDHSWAKQARERLEKEMDLVKHFYIEKGEKEQVEEEKEKENVMNKRLAELKWQFEPRIEVDIINGGLFYFTATH